ncbi:MAG TPA: triple tyrosine motif-containing protein, partial [Phnomibacter sp.]|nr:triple tyrosine motif-containing protein [Phnomibacter sp.]
NSQTLTWTKRDPLSLWVTSRAAKGDALLLSLLEDTSRNLLYAVSSDGIDVLDKQFRSTELLRDSLSAHFNYLIDHKGNLWFVKGHSLHYLDATTGKRTIYSTPDQGSRLKLEVTSYFFIDRTGLLWVGSLGYGIMALNTNALNFNHSDNRSIFDFHQREDGTILVNNGAVSFKHFDFQRAVYIDTIPVSKATRIFENFNEFHQPLFTDLNRRIWIAEQQNLYKFDPGTRKVDTFSLPLDLSNNVYGSVLEIVADGTGLLWLGTSGGLLSFNGSTRQWKVFRNIPGDSTSLSFNSIYCLQNDPVQPEKFLWIGTNGGGLNRLDLTTGKFRRFSMKDGLPNNVIYGILFDDDHRLWMSTNNGLSCFDPSTNTFRNFDESDGLQGNEFNHNAYMRSRDGTLYFGGINGFNYFNPRHITYNTILPQIVLTDLRIRNRSVHADDKDSPLKTAIYLTERIKLPYSDNMITFEFAAMDLSAPWRNLYLYKLEGFKSDWVDAGHNNTATYTNLDPGTYTFHVIGSNKDGVWNETGTSIELTILPPWYMTWWFRMLGVIIMAVSVYGFYRYRLGQAMQMMAVRNRIATDLHDEIGSNLSNISIFSNVARQQVGKPEQVGKILGKISEHTQASMEAMNDIVWMINPRNDRFENIMVRMRMLAAEICEATGYRLHLHLDETLNELKLSMDARKNFYLIFKEGINNIAKYAQGTEMWIDLQKNGGMIILIIRDNGRGFDKDEKEHGNGLHNMRERARLLKGNMNIQSRMGEGTKLELIFPIS